MHLDVALAVSGRPSLPGIEVGRAGALSFHVHIKHTLCIQSSWLNGKRVCCLTSAPDVEQCLAQLKRVAGHTGAGDVSFKLKAIQNYIGENNV